MPHSANIIAQVIISLSNPEVGDTISNLKLQKLLYYCQGFSLALHNKPLFNERIEAWQYGPVVPDVYHNYKSFSYNAIMPDENFDYSKHITEEEFALIREVYDVYGQFSALKLMTMTHNELPWSETKINQVIQHDILQKYFSTLITKDGGQA